MCQVAREQRKHSDRAEQRPSNVVVYISHGAPDEGQVPAQAVTFEQKGCQYIPHLLVMHTGQELKIVNRDQTSHKGDGGFRLPDLPPGRYTITAWHERYGDQTQTVRVTAGGSATVSITFASETSTTSSGPKSKP